MNILQKFEQKQIATLTENKRVDNFNAGDTIRVNVKIVEGESERIQAFEGICIARKSRGINSSFTVRKISHGEGVERVFPLYSPRIDSVELIRQGAVRRAKLYYMRDLSGKAARIKEKLDVQEGGNQNEVSAAKSAEVAKAKKAEKAEKAERHAKAAAAPKKKAEKKA